MAHINNEKPGKSIINYKLKYQMEDLENKVFIQGNTVGLASYHFYEFNPHISYSNIPGNWKLDNGEMPPHEKPFQNYQYDSDTRTFTGDILWEDATFKGDAKWKYTMIFDEDFTTIPGG